MGMIWLWLVSVVALSTLVTTTAAPGWTVTETKTKTLPIAGEVTFTSSFRAGDGDTIAISPADPAVTIGDVRLVRVTPKRSLAAASPSRGRATAMST